MSQALFEVNTRGDRVASLAALVLGLAASAATLLVR
jgi:hypothetical protein